MRTSNWFEFKASADMPESDLFLYGEVGGWGASAAEFIDALSTRKEQRINLHIHSPGGSVFEGHAIFTALKSHPGGVTTWVDGIAASMASVIAMAGAPVKMAGNAFLMIHNPWSQTAGGSDELRKQADVLDKLKESLVKIYADKSGMTYEEISAAMDSETWFSAEEAVAFGLADEVVEGMKAAAKIDLSRLSAKAPAGVFEFYAEHEKQIEKEGNTMENPEPQNAIEEAPVLPDFQSMLAKTEQDLLNAEARISGLSAELNAAQATLGASTAECEGLRAELEAERAKSAAVAEQVNAKAASLIASSGHAPVAIGSGPDDKNLPAKGRTILERFNELRRSGNSAEWLAFLRKNRSELIEAARTN
jgi:ATP-dependent Clp endopeptidase proteolytic subunit ClpP